MIAGFEKETQDLTFEEKRWAEIIADGLSDKIGKDRAITNKRIREGMRKNRGIEISDARLRKIIHHIRINGMVERLIATSSGYYVCTTDIELLTYIQSLEQRASSIDKIAQVMKTHLKHPSQGKL